ncbi:MAG: IclR family transcriptional regulator [Bacillota bacterium]
MRMNKSASRVVDILLLLTSKKRPITISEVSHALRIPKSSAFELLYTLVEKGFLQMADEKLKTFSTGIKLFEVGVSYLANTDLHREARPFLERIMSESGETAFLAVEDQGELVYLEKVEASSSVRTTAVLGSRKPMHCTALGKALLAAYDPQRVRSITGEGSLPSLTKYTITTYQALLMDLAKIRQRGYAIDDKESEIEVFCVAAPVYGQANLPIAAISIASLASKVDDGKLEQLSGLITAAALSISRRLGFMGEKLYF